MLRIQYERQRRDLSQTAVGAMVRIRQSHISMIERGRYTPTPRQLQRFADIFGVPAESLLTPMLLIPLDDVHAQAATR